MKYYLSLLLTLSFHKIVADQFDNVLSIDNISRSETVISIDPQIHIDYGLSYPITYEFSIPFESTSLKCYHKFQAQDNWDIFQEKTSNDFFNGLDVVRFDYTNGVAYVSVGFSDLSDSIFIKLTDNSGSDIESYYLGMSKYYDNRDAAVTSTADDWAGWVNEKFVQTCRIFRSYNLWLSCAIVTNVGDPNTWIDIQTQMDSGFVEPLAHSRTHPFAPYDDLEGEVLGSKQDLIDNLDMGEHNRYGDNEYVYAWVAPYGEYDDDIDSMVSIGKYLVTRMYWGGDHDYSTWNHESFKYDPIGVSTEAGPLWLGTTDTTYLNNTFDDVLASGGIYHVMCHPNVIEWDQEYAWVHLDYISNRKNIWYTAFGHLYAYHFLQSTYPEFSLTTIESKNILADEFVLHPNFPNPFNPVTSISFDILKSIKIKLDVYDQMGRIVRNLINSSYEKGYHSVIWDSRDNNGKQVPSGLYFYSIEFGNNKHTKKMLFIK